MKKLLLVALVPFMVQAQTSTTWWETPEYTKSRTLSAINASSAYSRGYTGKGSTIAIIDTGIDLKSSEFQKGKITLTKDFTGYNNVQDIVGHGSHVAGIAAAARNGTGMQGVAFDANLMIAKVTNTNALSFNTVLSALDWASTNKATVANMSASMSLNAAAINATAVAPGVYTTAYTNTAIYPGGMNPYQWASAMKNDIVFVIAAGNDRNPYPGAPAQMATATDNYGNLILGGRMIIAGNWDTQTNGIASSSNRAGTLCNVYVLKTCQDKYKTSDFYLMAPGTSIYSTVPTTVSGTGYATMTGTSMAAPVISGGVAIIHQMWPKMTGDKIVQLLMVTANKNLPNYKPEVMGQGLMDLEKATRPVGNILLPSTTPSKSPRPVTPILITSGSAGTAKISNVMVVDSFDRDFYIKGKYLTATMSLPERDARQAALPYLSRNAYSQFNNYSNYISNRINNLEVGVHYSSQNTPAMVEVAHYAKFEDTDVRFSVGSFSEVGTWLGNSLTSGNISQSNTVFAGLELNRSINDINLFSSLTQGVTTTNAYNDTVSNIGRIMSYSWTAGVEKQLDKKNALGFMVYQPVSVYRASADASLPVGMDGDTIVSTQRISLAATVKERRSGIYYKMLDKKDQSNVVAFFEHRQNYMGQEGLGINAVGVNANYRF